MLSTPHVLVALVIISRLPNFTGLILALLSHFVLDFFIPHWNPHLYTEISKNKKISPKSIAIILADGLIAVAFTLYFMMQRLPFFNQAFLVGLAAFLAVLPDFIEIPYYFLNYEARWIVKYVEFEHQYQSTAAFFWGIATQVVVILASLQVLF
jgi:hypothetical protein